MQNIQGIGCACRLKIPFDQKVQTEWGDFGLDATVRPETTLILSADRNTRKNERRKSF